MSVGVVVNPVAGGGRLASRWPSLRAELEARLGPLWIAETKAPGEARELAARHVADGAKLVIAAGGDGTVNEVVDGVLAAGPSGGLELGIVPVGTGRDLWRTLGEGDARAAVGGIASGRTRRIDVGRVTYQRVDGGTGVRHFINVSSVGLSAEIAAAVNRTGRRRVSGRTLFYLETIKGILRYRPERVRVTFDGAETIEVDTALVAVANGRYFGGGMMVLPDARIDDGLFDVLVYAAPGWLRMILDFNLIYRGQHTRLPRVTIRRCRSVEVLPVGGSAAMLETDGESPGRAPARFEIMPGALVLRG